MQDIQAVCWELLIGWRHRPRTTVVGKIRHVTILLSARTIAYLPYGREEQYYNIMGLWGLRQGSPRLNNAPLRAVSGIIGAELCLRSHVPGAHFLLHDVRAKTDS